MSDIQRSFSSGIPSYETVRNSAKAKGLPNVKAIPGRVQRASSKEASQQIQEVFKDVKLDQATSPAQLIASPSPVIEEVATVGSLTATQQDSLQRLKQQEKPRVPVEQEGMPGREREAQVWHAVDEDEDLRAADEEVNEIRQKLKPETRELEEQDSEPVVEQNVQSIEDAQTHSAMASTTQGRIATTQLPTPKKTPTDRESAPLSPEGHTLSIISEGESPQPLPPQARPNSRVSVSPEVHILPLTPESTPVQPPPPPATTPIVSMTAPQQPEPSTGSARESSTLRSTPKAMIEEQDTASSPPVPRTPPPSPSNT